YNAHPKLFWDFEVFSVIVFTIEYITRLWVCTLNPKYASPVWGRLRYIFSFMGLVDLLAILPFYIPMVIRMDLRFLRALRLFRLFRVFKVERYWKSLHLLSKVLKEKRAELLMTLFAIFISLIIASSLMYYVENEAQPKVFSSIPAAMWWGVTTLTTVGYG